MKKLILLFPFLLTGCTVNPVQVAADAAFCSSAESVLTNVQKAYEEQIVDSEFINSTTEFLSTIAEPLSDSLGDDIDQLSNELSSSAPVSESQDAIDDLLLSIKDRCAEVGVEF